MSVHPALVHDYLLVMRGAERTFAAMADCWPDAPISTLLYDAGGTASRFESHSVRTSYLQRLPLRQRGFRALLPLFPRAAERLPVDGGDVVISSSSAFAHGVRPADGVAHVCYCHSPFRYAWHERDRALAEVPGYARLVLPKLLDRIQEWDCGAAERVAGYIANSQITRERIQRYWARDAEVVHPPVEVDRFTPGVASEKFLFVGELTRHKQVGLALEAAKRAEVPIQIVGTGPDAERLAARYGDRAEFLGRVDDAQLAKLMASARALVVPNVEEFGIAAVEAQAAGRPVVAAAAGGALETVVEGETGILVPPGDLDAMTEALAYVDYSQFEPHHLVANADRFSARAFQQRLVDEVERLLDGAPLS